MAKNELILGYSKVEFERNLDRAFACPFVAYEDLEDEMYRFFIDDGHAVAWFNERRLSREEGRAMDAVIASYEFAGRGIAGTPNYTASVEFLHGDGERAPEGSTGNYISIRPKIEDRSKNDTHESISVYINISNNGESRPPIYDIVRSNTVYTVNIDDYIKLGDNDIVITIEGRASGARKTVVMSYNVFRLAIDCGFNFSQPVQHNRNFSVNYTVKGNGQKDVFFYIDGAVSANHIISANEADVTLSQIISNSGDKALTPGKHSLQIYAVSNGYASDLLYYEFIVEGVESTFTTCLVAHRFPAGTSPFTGSLPGFSGTQYVTKVLDWAYFSNDPTQRSPRITWRLFANGVETHLATRTADILEAENGKLPNPLEFMPTDFGSYRLQAIIDGYNYVSPVAHRENSGDDHDDPTGLIACYSIDVAKNSQVQEAVDGIQTRLSALGRSNDEPTEPVDIRSQFSDRGVSAVFHNMPFNNRYGYVDNAVVFGGGAYMTIPLNPFSSERDVRENGNTMEIDFETFDVKEEDTPLFQLGSLDDIHVCIYATKAEIKTARGVGPEVRFRANTRYKISFVTHPDTDLDGRTRRFMEMYVDGIRTAVVQYATTDSLVVAEGDIMVGNPNAMAGFKLYTFRSYTGCLQDYNVLNNYIIDSGQNINALVKRNDIYVEGSRTKVSVDKLKGILPVWELTGPFDRMISAKDKIEFDGYAKYTDTENPDLNIESPIANFKTSGESSLSDNMQKGIHVKFNKNGNQLLDGEGKPVYGNRWTPFIGNALERKIRLNSDGLESSHIHNMVIENMINEVFPKVQIGGKYVLRTPAQEYVLSGQYAKDMQSIYSGEIEKYDFPYKINYASDWKPVAVVWRPDENSEYELYGIFSMGEEKKSDFTHGRRSIYLKMTEDGKLDPYDFYSGEKGERGYDNAGTVQFEMVRDSALTFMTDASRFDSDAKIDCEKIYQDEDDCTDEENNREWQLFGNEVIRPVASTYIRTDHDEDGVPHCVLDQDAFHELIFSGRFNVWSFLAARSLIRKLGLTDTYVRNSQWLRLPKQVKNATQWNWWFAYWDLDMAFGLQQPSGSLIIPPGSDRNSRVGDSFVFTGKRGTTPESSAFWDGIDEEMRLGKQRIIDAGDDESAIASARVENMYYMFTQLEDALNAAGFTVENVLKNSHAMMAKYGEALYNADGQAKYIDTLSDGANYLPRLQGSRASHLDWWAYESFERWEAETATGPYQTNAVSLNLTANDPSSKIKIVAGGHSFFGWGLTSTPIATGVEKNTGDAFEFIIGRSLNGNDPVKIYMPNKIAELDLSDAGDRISGRIELGKFYNEGTGITLRKLNLGVPKERMAAGVFNNFDGKTWTGLNYLTTLEELNIQGYRFVTAQGTLDMSNMANLMRFYAAGATGLTALQPADGTHMTDYQLPDSIQSLVLDSCTITDNGITWWHDAVQTTLPTSLKVLNMSGMGNDEGAHGLFIDWIRMAASLGDDDRLQYRVSYTNAHVTDMEKSDILTLVAMKSALSSSVSLSGYIHCRESYTSEDIKAIKDAFGEEAFTLSNNIVFDCNSDQIIISATGDGVTVIDENTIEVVQGTNAQFSATGFPIVSSMAPIYEWIVFDNGEPHRGSDIVPNIPFGDHSMNFRTGLMKTAECADEDTTYRVYVQKNTGGDGSVNVVIKRRTYPTEAKVEMVYASNPAEIVGDEISIASTGHYIFDANHLPAGYTGTMKNVDGGKWTIDGISEEYVRSCVDNFVEGRTPFDEFCMQVVKFPNYEAEILLKYESNWKGGQKIVAPDVKIALMTVIYNLLSNNQLTGNPAMFYALEASGLEHADNYSYNSGELKKYIGDIDFNALLVAAGRDPMTLTSLTSGQYNVMKYLKNVTGVDVSNTGATGDLDFSTNSVLRKVNASGTAANVIPPQGSHFNELHLGSPSKVTVSKDNSIQEANFSIDDASNVEELNVNEPSTAIAFSVIRKMFVENEQQD